MRKLASCIILLVLVPAFVTVSQAQENSHPSKATVRVDADAVPAHFYTLHYVLEELDATGKPVNSRSFSMTVSTGGTRTGIVVVGSRIPIVTGTVTPKSATNTFQTQFQYVDLGVKMTATQIHDDGDRLAFNLNAEISSPGASVMLSGVSEPVFHQNVWRADVLVPIGKPTIVFNSDDLDSKGSMQLQVTATRID
jgi:hypothetical protein